MRQKMWRILQLENEPGSIGYWVNVGLATLIVLNIADVAAETVPAIAQQIGGFLRGFEVLSVGVFTVEYLLRLWASAEDPRYSHPVLGRLRYALSPMALIDLVAIAPFYLPWMGVDLLSLRAFRLLRLLRLLKLGRYSDSLQLMARVFRNRRIELFSTAVIAGFLLVVAASLLHAAEGDVQPDRFGSMPDSLWWAVVTMTTVGYGDVYPVTALGKVLAGFVALLGIGLFALPTAILGAGFLEETGRRNNHHGNRPSCPHCGGLLE